MEIQLTSDITVRLIDKMGGDHSVVAAAKVSVCGEDALAFSDPEKAADNAGLINYLMKNRHFTPFEHSSLTFFVHAPIFVWREWHRHRTLSFNEESARYKKLNPVFWIPRRDRKMVPIDDWKPSKPKFKTLDDKHGDYADTLYDLLISEKRIAYEAAYKCYQNEINYGVAMEVARSVLPVGIYSSCWVSCNVRNLMGFLSLRTYEPQSTYPSFAQAEIEECARACEEVFKQGWPLTYEAFCKNGRVGA